MFWFSFNSVSSNIYVCVNKGSRLNLELSVSLNKDQIYSQLFHFLNAIGEMGWISYPGNQRILDESFECVPGGKVPSI